MVGMSNDIINDSYKNRKKKKEIKYFFLPFNKKTSKFVSDFTSNYLHYNG